MTNITIRPARPDDLPALESLARRSIRQVYEGILSEADLELWETGDAARQALEGLWPELEVAEMDGAVAGLSHVAPSDMINMLWVDPERQGRGVGKALLAAAEAKIFSAGHKQARLFCYARNEKARAFFRSQGWRFYSERILAGDIWEIVKMKRNPNLEQPE